MLLFLLKRLAYNVLLPWYLHLQFQSLVFIFHVLNILSLVICWYLNIYYDYGFCRQFLFSLFVFLFCVDAPHILCPCSAPLVFIVCTISVHRPHHWLYILFNQSYILLQYIISVNIGMLSLNLRSLISLS